MFERFIESSKEHDENAISIFLLHLSISLSYFLCFISVQSVAKFYQILQLILIYFSFSNIIHGYQ